MQEMIDAALYLVVHERFQALDHFVLALFVNMFRARKQRVVKKGDFIISIKRNTFGYRMLFFLGGVRLKSTPLAPAGYSAPERTVGVRTAIR